MLPKFSIKKPLTIVVVLIIILILGVVSYMGMQEDLLPDMNLPYLVVVTIYAGAQPDVVEAEITTPLEEAFASVSNINRLNSVSNEHYSMIIMELKTGSDVDSVKNALTDAITFTTLPDSDMRQDPIIIKLDPSMLPIMRISMGYDGETNDEKNEFLEEVMEKVGAVDGVAGVSKSGLVSSYAYLNSNTQKTAEFLTTQVTERLGISLHVPDAVKDSLRTALCDVFETAKNNPDLQTNGKVDPAKVLDAMLDRFDDGQIEAAEEEDDPLSKIIAEYVIIQLRQEGIIRDSATGLIEYSFEHAYILEDGEENKLIFNSLIDNFTDDAINGILKKYMSSMLSVLNQDLYSQLIMAQDFNYPAGSADKGASSYVVKVGDKIGNREDFINMPVLTLDMAQEVQEYLGKAETILRLFASVSTDGNIRITDSQLHALAQYFAYAVETEQVSDYGKWVVDLIVSDNEYSPYFASPTARETWAELINDEINDNLIPTWGEERPHNWRTQVLNYVIDNGIFPEEGTQIAGEVLWGDDYSEYYANALAERYDNAKAGKPEDVSGYADYVVSMVAFSEEIQTAWKNALVSDEGFIGMAARISESENADWRLSTLKYIEKNEVYPDSWTEGTVTAVDTVLRGVIDTMTAARNNTPENYAEIITSALAVQIRFNDFYVERATIDVWRDKIAADEGFIALVTELNAESDDYLTKDYGIVLYGYLADDAEEYVETLHASPESVLLPVGEVAKNGRTWSETDVTMYTALLEGDLAVYTAMEEVENQIIESVGEEEYEKLLTMFRGRTEESNYELLKSVLSLLDRFGGEGAVTETVNDAGEAVYVIDIRLIANALSENAGKLKITILLGNLCDVTFIDDVSKQVSKLVYGMSDDDVQVKSAIQISIDKEPTAASKEVTDGVKSTLENIAKDNPKFSYTVLSDDGDTIGFMLNSVLKSLLIGGLLALCILVFFLKDIKATLVIGSSILISVITAVVLMYFSGVSLNIISLGGLTLGVGMLVDNSVVVLENTYRLRAKGYTVMQAAVQGAKQMLPAIFGSTLTTAVVFLPILFVNGVVKEIFVDFALTICYSLGASLLVSMTVVPMAYNTFMVAKPAKKNSRWARFKRTRIGSIFTSDGVTKEGKLAQNFKKAYVRALNFVLNHKVVAIIVTVVLFGGSLLAAFSVGTEYFPDTYMGYISISVDINADEIDARNHGLTYEDDNYYTYNDAEQEVTEILIGVVSEYSDIKAVGIAKETGLTVGGMSLGSGNLSATVTLVDEKDRSMTARELVNSLQYTIDRRSNKLFSATVDMYSLSSMIDMGTNSTKVYVYGSDYSEMQAQSKLLAEKMMGIEGVISVDNGIPDTNKEYRIIVDKEKANKYGLTVGQVYLQITEALKAPSEIHELTLAKNDKETEKMSVLVYDSEYLSKYWFEAFDDKGEKSKVYFQNNATDDDSSDINEYYISSPFYETVYIKDANGRAQSIAPGDYIPVTREGDSVYFTYGTVSETKKGTHYITYVKKYYILNDKVKYYTTGKADVDLVTLNITSENMLDSSAPKTTVPLYKMLADECLITDKDGKVLYRQSTTDSLIPVGIKLSDGYSAINHVSYRKCITMEVTYDEKASSSKVNNAIEDVINEYNLDKPTKIEVTTKSTGGLMDNVFNDLYKILGLAIVLVFLVMVAQFQSWKSPFIIMGTIVLAFTGSFLLMAITGTKIGIMSLIGMIVLMGVVVNNGIVFVDYTNSLVERGMSKREALLRAGNDRIRPILMTAITTVLGMLAMALDGSDYGAMLQPLAIAMIGGLAYATMMTLFIVPTLYDLLNRRTDLRTEKARIFKATDFDFEEQDNTEADNGMGAYIESLAETSRKAKEEKKGKRKGKKAEEEQRAEQGKPQGKKRTLRAKYAKRVRGGNRRKSARLGEGRHKHNKKPAKSVNSRKISRSREENAARRKSRKAKKMRVPMTVETQAAKEPQAKKKLSRAQKNRLGRQSVRLNPEKKGIRRMHKNTKAGQTMKKCSGINKTRKNK